MKEPPVLSPISEKIKINELKMESIENKKGSLHHLKKKCMPCEM